MKIVFLLAVFWIQRYIGAPNCCTSKNVGGLEYTLLRVEDTSQYNCLTNCVYEKVGDPVPGRKYCFGTGDQKVECKGDSLVCGEDLKTLHGLLNASSYTFDAHCCNNGISTNYITCGNGTDCSSVCEVQATCAKVVFDQEEGEDYCSPRDSHNLNQHGMTIHVTCDFMGHHQATSTTCNIMAWGLEETNPPSYPDFCFKKNTYYGIDFNKTCSKHPQCSVCDCCPEGHVVSQLGMNNLFHSSGCQTSLSTSLNITLPPVNIDWKSGMEPTQKCVDPETVITFNWNNNHNVVRLTPEAFSLCNFTGKDTKIRTGPFKLKPSPPVNFSLSYFFASGVGDDCKNGMKAEITISNDCDKGCPAGWKEYQTKCYKRFDALRNWQQAEMACQKCEGHLASINSKGEDTFINNLGVNLKAAWVGGFKIETWGLWTDGSTWNYTNWQPGQPSGDGNCTNMLNYYYGLNDRPCDGKLQYICEIFVGKKSKNCEDP